MKKLELKVLLKEQEERLEELEKGYTKLDEYISIKKNKLESYKTKVEP